jgi:uncharacterized protein YjiS (DUF1127 family)
MEMIMSTMSSAPTAAQAIFGPSWMAGLVATLKRWWMAYVAYRIDQAAIAQLESMSDRTLKDIGLTRSGIPRAVMCDLAIDRVLGPMAERPRPESPLP